VVNEPNSRAIAMSTRLLLAQAYRTGISNADVRTLPTGLLRVRSAVRVS
jgi:hypothetical protein